MFAYCGNNPVNRLDSEGLLWETILDICNDALNIGKDLWNKGKEWISNTFGAKSTVTQTISKKETEIVPAPSPITVTSGNETTTVVSQSGDSSKPISVYANGDIDAPLSSSVGIVFNFKNGDALNISIGLDNTGISYTTTDAGSINSVGLRINPL